MDKTKPATLITSHFPNVGEMPVSWGLAKEIRPADDHKAIVDLDTGKLFSIVSKGYRIIRHEEAIAQVEQAIAGTQELGQYQAVTEFSNDGGRMKRTYRFPGIMIEVRKGDLIHPELHLFNSYDTKWPFVVFLGAFRVVCTNGLVVGEKFLHLRKRHIYELGQIDVGEEVSTALKRFKHQARQWKGWTERRLTKRSYEKVIEVMKLGIKARELIEQKIAEQADDFDPDGFPIISLWDFYNVLAWHTTHNAVSLNHRVDMEARLRAASVHWRG